MTWTLLGMLLVPLLIVGFARARREHLRNGLALMVPFAGLLFCVVFVDQLYHSGKHLFFGSGNLIDMVEDGGEMIAITFATAMAGVIARRKTEERKTGALIL